MNRRLIIPVILSILMASLAYAQGPRYVELRPVRSDAIGGTLGDIDSQLPAGHHYKDSDKVTWAHEACHGVNARIRNEHGAANGFYIRRNRGFIIPSPALTLAEVARAIPHGKRGRVYQLYMVDAARHWNDTPFYCADEMVAYTMGSRAGLELGMKARSLYSFANALEMWRYTRVASRLSRERGFRHQAELEKFLDEFHRDNIHWLLVEYKRRGWR